MGTDFMKSRWRPAEPKYGVCTENGERLIAYIPNYDDDTKEDLEQRTRLISAAPVLEEALIRALPYVECALDDEAFKKGSVKKDVNFIRYALDKACLPAAALPPVA